MSWTDVENTGQDSEKIPYSKFENGNTLIRVLDDEPYSFWSHWLESQQTSVTCRGKDCPICNIIAQMKANKEPAIYNSTQRHAIRIWNYTTNQMEIMIQGKNFMNQLLTLHKEVGDIKGYDVKLVRKGTGTDTTYTLLPTNPQEFVAPEGKITDVVMSETFAAPSKEDMLLLMEGKTWKEINESDAAA